MIPFNKIHTTGEEIKLVKDAIQSGKIAGDGPYTKLCETFFEKRYGFKKALLMPSCTDALELSALLINIQPGDEVIMPTYTFVSMANAFILRGAKIIFADSNENAPNVDVDEVKRLITNRTKAIVVVHYGGIGADIEALRNITDKHQIYLIEDAAHAIDSFYGGKPLGSFGHLATFSFHETKNITCGEGGLLVINDERLISRAEVLREKGTNRSSFNRKEIDQYSWIDIGSSYLASDISAAFLYAQLTKLDDIQKKRKKLWEQYYNGLKELTDKKLIRLPFMPVNSMHNGHVFYLICPSSKIRDEYISYMCSNGVMVQFHYITLHDSPFYNTAHGNRELPLAKHYQDCLVRLPLFYDLDESDANLIILLTYKFFLHGKS